MKYSIYIFTLLALIINAPSAVCSETSKRAKIENIVTMWNMDKELGSYHDDCIASYNLGSPEILVKDNPNHFDGIRPGSPYWDNIVTIWNKYVETSCGFMNAKKYKEALINSLSSQLTQTDIDDVLRFYKTKSGQTYLKAQEATSSKMQKYYREIASVAAKTAYDTYMSELKIVTDNYFKMQHAGNITVKSHLYDYFTGIGGMVGGLLLFLAPRISKTKYARWASRSFIIAGVVSIIWGVLILRSCYATANLDQRIVMLTDHYKTFLGGLWLGIILTLLIAGQFKRSQNPNDQVKESIDK